MLTHAVAFSVMQCMITHNETADDMASNPVRCSFNNEWPDHMVNPRWGITQFAKTGNISGDMK